MESEAERSGQEAGEAGEQRQRGTPPEASLGMRTGRRAALLIAHRPHRFYRSHNLLQSQLVQRAGDALLPSAGALVSLERAEHGNVQILLLSCTLGGSSTAEKILFQGKNRVFFFFFFPDTNTTWKPMNKDVLTW